MTPLGVDDVVCLGDVVGYGPAPDTCLDLVIKYCGIMVQGNHDAAAVDPCVADSFNGAAREAALWTRDKLGPMHLDELNRLKTVEFIGDSVMCVHDSPVPGPTDYIHDPTMASMAFRGVDMPICLLGHTHVPMVFETNVSNVESTMTPRDVNAYLMRDGHSLEFKADHRYICNPGSVGQPRDCDPRASFAVIDLDARTFTVHRADYDIAAAQADTLRAGLPTVLADRLAIGA